MIGNPGLECKGAGWGHANMMGDRCTRVKSPPLQLRGGYLDLAFGRTKEQGNKAKLWDF